MNKKNTNDEKQIKLLEEQVAYLNKDKQALFNALEMAVNLSNFQTSLNKEENTEMILKTTATRAQTVIRFNAVSFYLVNEQDLSFYPAYCDPEYFLPRAEDEVNALINDKIFSWALRRGKPTIVSSTNKIDNIMLHPLNTASGTRGMFLGLLGQDRNDISDTSLILFTIAMLSGADELESFILSEQIKNMNEELTRTNEQLLRDIARREEAEKALREAEGKYRGIFENAVEGIFQTTPEGKYISVNPALARMLKYDSPEQMMQSIIDISGQSFVRDEDASRLQNILEEEGIIEGFETQYFRKDWTIIWVSINARAVKDTEGRILCHEGTIEDITARKEGEEQLKYEKQKFSTLSENAPFGMVMIDKNDNFSYINPKFTEIFGYDLSDVPDGKAWFKKAYPDPEYRHTVINAWVEYFAKAKAGEQRQAVFTVTCRDGTEKIIDFIPVQLESGIQIMSCEDITSRTFAQKSLEQTMAKLRKSLAGTIQAISLTVEIRDPYTAGHQKRVSSLARTISQEMALPKDTIDSIRMAGAIHDIGKMSVPGDLLSKPTRLTDIEMSLIKVHSQAGYDILKSADLPYPIAEIVLQHHERLDGSGYPRGLKDRQILLESQIIAVADVVEAISSHRPYRPSKGVGVALEEIEKNKGIFYDPEVVDACLRLFREKGFEFESTWS